METLLKHSFWGNEERSNFWNNKRPITIDKQLEEYVKNFEQYEKQSIIELQEFYNLFYTAKMTQEKYQMENSAYLLNLLILSQGFQRYIFTLLQRLVITAVWQKK
ncbi:hypothetical protein I3679_020880 [Proteus mirabilis]|uniref:Uncharacterized protein n=1 Tax=Proteus mirabilis TaxID=584 RepID=A0ABD5LZ60_PROMI